MTKSNNMGGGLPSPPLEDQKSQSSRKSSSAGSGKSIKAPRHTSKRASSHNATAHHDQAAHGVTDGRHKRVWKACERCRMKKTKCDGEFPCKRCKDDGLVCTAGVRKKTEYKQLPKGYAEVLEHTQFALVATVHKLYAMVRNQQQWTLGEPELNDRGQPIIHNIAYKLGSIRPNSDIDLPVHSVFPEDEAGMAELARQLEEQQQQQSQHGDHEMVHDKSSTGVKTEFDSQSSCNLSAHSSPSEPDHSDFETDYRQQLFSGNTLNSNAMTMSPQSFQGYNDFELDASPADPAATVAAFSKQQSSQQQQQQQQIAYSHYAAAAAAASGQAPQWASKPTMDFQQQFLQQTGALTSTDMLNQGLMESEFGTIKPHVLNCPNPEVMMGMGDPMIYSGYDFESTMRL